MDSNLKLGTLLCSVWLPNVVWRLIFFTFFLPLKSFRPEDNFYGNQMVALWFRNKDHIFASKKMIKRKSTERMRFERKKKKGKNYKRDDFLMQEEADQRNRIKCELKMSFDSLLSYKLCKWISKTEFFRTKARAKSKPYSYDRRFNSVWRFTKMILRMLTNVFVYYYFLLHVVHENIYRSVQYCWCYRIFRFSPNETVQ